MALTGRRAFLKSGLAATAGAALGGFARKAAAQGTGLVSVRGVMSAPGLSFAAIYVANRRRLWQKHGLDAEMRLVQGGPMAMVSLTNSEADFACVSVSDPLIAWDKGIKTLSIAAFNSAICEQFTAHKDWLAGLGLTPQSPLAAKVAALKGARIGASTVGGAPAQYTRFLASKFGIDPQKDLRILAVGFGPSRIAALRQRQVDVTIGGSPEADEIELEGFGRMFIDCATALPEFAAFPYETLIVTPEFAAQKPDVARRIAQSVGEATDLLHSDFAAAINVLKTEFPKIDPRAIEASMKRDIGTFPAGARGSPEMWRNAVAVASALKSVAHPPPAEEDVIWTDRFL